MSTSSILSRTLWLFGLTLSALAGCGGNTRSGAAGAEVDFRIFDVDDKGYTTPLTCADVDAVGLTTTLTNVSTLKTYSDNWNCDDVNWTLRIPAVPPGNYTIDYTLVARSPIGNIDTLDAFSMPTDRPYYPLGTGTTVVDSAYFLVNSFLASWQIYRGSVATTCAAMGATQVQLDVTYPNGVVRPYVFPCMDSEGYMSGQTIGIPYGPYQVSWQMHLLAGTTKLRSTPLQTFNVADPLDYRIAELPAVAFNL